MSRLFTCFLLTLFLNTWARDERFPQTPIPAGTPGARGAWLARQADARDTGDDTRVAMRMRLYDRQDRTRERALTLLAIRGGAGRRVPADRSLTRFTYPNDIRGTGFLVIEQPTGDAERFLFLPALGRVRRIAGAEAQESFVGSDFTYEDIGGREFDDYTYTLLEENAAHTVPGGSTTSVYKLESRSKDANARFPRVVSLVRKDSFVIVHADVHNRRDEVQKTFDALRVERVAGFWTVMEMVMRDQLQRTRTELVMEKVEYNVGLTADDVSRRELERGVR